MGFKRVYQNLVELFPQVDSRILKAVAIEHPKDADAAADIVISEILPHFSSHPVVDSAPKLDNLSDGRAEHKEQNGSSNDLVDWGRTVGCSSELSLTEKGYSCKTNLGSGGGHTSYSTYPENATSSSVLVTSDSKNDTKKLLGNAENDELILLVSSQHQENDHFGTGRTSEFMSNASFSEEKTNDLSVCDTIRTELPPSLRNCQDDNISAGGKQTFQTTLASLAKESGELDDGLTGFQNEWKDFDGSSPDDSDKCGNSSPFVPCIDGDKSPQVSPYLHSAELEVVNSVVESKPDAAEVDFKSELCSPTPGSNKDLIFSQDIRIDILDDVVDAAKSNKRTLFLAMESIMNMMREVELQEKAAEEAKVEASSAGLDTLVKVNELKQMLAHAKEANDMHAGEVYGERAILATEVRELQARLFSLSDERDKALSFIDEMHRSLEERLAATEELKKTAEMQKLEREEAARNALAEQEAIMGKVVQESKILQQEADENAKIREFLMDRGRIVDALQGEISVICQDVRLLKEKFDERVPLSKSISSSQTSCILASSGSSSLKSSAYDLVPEPREASKSLEERSRSPSIDGQLLNSPKQRSPTPSTGGQSPRIKLEEEDTMNRGMVLDDDWEFFE